MTNEIVYTNIELDEILTSATIEKGMELAQPSKTTSIDSKQVQVQPQRSIDYKNIIPVLQSMMLDKEQLKSFNKETKQKLYNDINNLVNSLKTKSPETFIVFEKQEVTNRTTIDLSKIIEKYDLTPIQKNELKQFIINFVKNINTDSVGTKFVFLNKSDINKSSSILKVNELKDISPTHIDLLKSNVLNESFLRMFGTAIEMIVGRMFGKDVQLPYLTISGSPQQMQALTDTLSKEKRYVDSYVKYGLDDPRTYQDQYKLQNAINNFEKETGIKWPIK